MFVPREIDGTIHSETYSKEIGKTSKSRLQIFFYFYNCNGPGAVDFKTGE
jgi:hypothetical protein